MPFLSRLYTPSELSVYASSMVLISVVFSFSSLRMEFLAFALSYQKEKKIYFLKGLQYISLFHLFGSVSFLCVGADTDYDILFVVYFGVVFNYLAFQALSNGDSKFFSFYKTLQVMVFVLLACLFSLDCFEYRINHALLTSFSLSILVLLFRYRNDYSFTLLKESFFYKFELRQWKNIFFCTAANFLTMVTPAVTYFFILKFYGAAEGVVYFVIAQLIGGPISMIRRSVVSVFAQNFNDKDKVFYCLKKLREFFVVIILVLLTITSLFYYFSELFFSIIFSNSFEIDPAIATLLIVLYLIDLLAMSLNISIPLGGKAMTFSFYEIIKLINLIFICSMCYAFSFNLVSFISLYVVSMSLISIYTGFKSYSILQNYASN